MAHATLINGAYLVASVLFILGLKGLTHPRTAVRGNMLGATGMLLAIMATLLDQQIFGAGAEAFGWILGGVVLGATIGGGHLFKRAFHVAIGLLAIVGQVFRRCLLGLHSDRVPPLHDPNVAEPGLLR